MQKITLAVIFLILAEMAVLIMIGNWIGIFPTLLLVILTSVLGIYFTKKNGLNSAKAVQTTIKNGQAPGVALIDGFLTLLGGFFLIIPGFITDILGLLMMFGSTKKIFKPAIFYWLRKKMKNNQIIIYQK